MHAIMMNFMILGHLTRPRGLFRAQGSALTRNVARVREGGRHGAPLPPGLATLRVNFRRRFQELIQFHLPQLVGYFFYIYAQQIVVIALSSSMD